MLIHFTLYFRLFALQIKGGCNASTDSIIKSIIIYYRFTVFACLGAIRDMIKEAGFNVPLFTCDGGGQVEAGHVEGALPTLNGVFGQ